MTKFYSPLNFLVNGDAPGVDFLEELTCDLKNGTLEVFLSNNNIKIYYRELTWDSEFFGLSTFRIDYSIAPEKEYFHLFILAFEELSNFLLEKYANFYLFAEVPSEDINTLSAMTGAGYRLIETRLTYFRNNLKDFEFSRRPLVRSATVEDIPVLNKVAMESVNYYDRFHADSFFTESEADLFLAKYVENSVLGFADEVMFPADGVANAFLTANYLNSPSFLSNRNVAKMVLSAVAPERRGWYVKLIGEMTLKFKDKGVDAVFMTTQSTNRAVLKVWDSFGYRFARCTHVLSSHKRND